MAAPADIAVDDVLLIRARAIGVHKAQGLVAVRIAEPTAFGGPGYRTEVLSIDAVAEVEADPPTDRKLVPLRAGR
jgi:hypothetical protein